MHARELSPSDDFRSLWTLVPVLVLVGLAVMGEIPRRAGESHLRPANGVVRALTR